MRLNRRGGERIGHRGCTTPVQGAQLTRKPLIVRGGQFIERRSLADPEGHGRTELAPHVNRLRVMVPVHMRHQERGNVGQQHLQPRQSRIQAGTRFGDCPTGVNQNEIITREDGVHVDRPQPVTRKR
jgi:hypothetical protein